MNGDLISRSELLGTESLLRTDIVENDPVAKFVLDQILHDIKASPAVEAEPVKHAHWEKFKYPSGTHGIRCSHCEVANGRKSKFCPECGAHMDEEVAE